MNNMMNNETTVTLKFVAQSGYTWEETVDADEVETTIESIVTTHGDIEHVEQLATPDDMSGKIIWHEEITNMNTLTLEQKQAAATVNRLQQDAETNDTTVANVAAEAGIPAATIQLGQSVLSTHTLRRFDTHSSLSSAHRQADEIEQDGYEPLIEEWSGPNPYVVWGFRPNTTA